MAESFITRQFFLGFAVAFAMFVFTGHMSGLNAHPPCPPVTSTLPYKLSMSSAPLDVHGAHSASPPPLVVEQLISAASGMEQSASTTDTHASVSCEDVATLSPEQSVKFTGENPVNPKWKFTPTRPFPTSAAGASMAAVLLLADPVEFQAKNAALTEYKPITLDMFTLNLPSWDKYLLRQNNATLLIFLFNVRKSKVVTQLELRDNADLNKAAGRTKRPVHFLTKGGNPVEIRRTNLNLPRWLMTDIDQVIPHCAHTSWAVHFVAATSWYTNQLLFTPNAAGGIGRFDFWAKFDYDLLIRREFPKSLLETFVETKSLILYHQLSPDRDCTVGVSQSLSAFARKHGITPVAQGVQWYEQPIDASADVILFWTGFSQSKEFLALADHLWNTREQFTYRWNEQSTMLRAIGMFAGPQLSDIGVDLAGYFKWIFGHKAFCELDAALKPFPHCAESRRKGEHKWVIDRQRPNPLDNMKFKSWTSRYVDPDGAIKNLP